MSDIQFVEVDSEKIQNDLIKQFEDTLGTTLYPGDERRIFLLQFLPILVGLKNSINETGKQNLLRYATGTVLDELGRDKTPRLPAKKAVVTLRFILSAIQTVDVLIPKGTRATPDGKIYFATTVDLIIPAGQTTGDVKAESTEAGEAYNGYIPGQIKTIVDPVAYVASVVNTDKSGGGADIETDDHYRERIRLAPESYSTAGPEGAYIYWAKTADANISDISVVSPSPNVVNITVLMKNGELPVQTILDAVYAAVSPRDRRPMGDNVQVQAPTVDTYNITLTYYISKDRSTEETAIRNAIEGTGGAKEQYIAWQSERLGRAINPDYLRNLMLSAGAFRINLTNPSYTAVAADHVAKAGTVTVNYGGLI